MRKSWELLARVVTLPRTVLSPFLFTHQAIRNFPRNRRPVALDLFAGAGGFSLGIEQAGFDVVAAIEFDPVHAAVYAFNFPYTTVVWADASTLGSREIADAAARGWASHPVEVYRRRPIPAWDGEVDLIIGGPPCQGFAITGKQPIEDERNDLVFEFCRLVIELQPRYFIMENVPSLLEDRYSDLLNQLISKFESASYKVTLPVQVLNAAEFGVPQDRQRLFLLGTRQGYPVLSYPDPAKAKGVTGTVGNGVSVGEAIADLPDVDKFPELLETDQVLLSSKQLEELEESATDYGRSLRGLTQHHDRDRFPIDFAYPRAWNEQLLTSSMRTVHTPECISRFEKTALGKVEPQSRLRRLHSDGLCSPLRAGTDRERGRHTSPRPIHPLHPRVISVREAARLHSFPDWFRFHATKWHGFRQVGNAVPPALARAVGAQVVAALGVEPPVFPQSLPPVELGDSQLLWMSPSEASRYWQEEQKKSG